VRCIVLQLLLCVLQLNEGALFVGLVAVAGVLQVSQCLLHCVAVVAVCIAVE